MPFFSPFLRKQNVFVTVKNQNIQTNWKRKRIHIILHTADTLGVSFLKFSYAKQIKGSYCKYCFVVCLLKLSLSLPQ